MAYTTRGQLSVSKVKTTLFLPMPRIRIVTLFALVATLVVLVAACDKSPDQTSTGNISVQRDTVGDTVVVRSSGPGEWGDSVKLTEELRIGSIEGGDDYTFGSVYDIVVGPDGTIFVSDARQQSVRVYDATGKFVRRIGRKGRGPGEFERLGNLALRRDGTLLAYDGELNRVNIFSPTGEPRGALKWNAAMHMSGPDMIRTDTAGNVYVMAILGMPTPTGMPPVGFVRFDASDAARDTIPPIVWPDQGGTRAVYDPFGFSTLTRSGDVVAGFGNRYAIEIRPRTGKILRIERTGEQPVNVSAAERHYHDSMRAKRYENPAMIKTGALRNVPGTKPMFQGLRVDDDNRICVQRHVASVERTDVTETPTIRAPLSGASSRWVEPVRVWDVFKIDGTYLGRITLPGTAQIFAQRGDKLWGTFEDETGGLHVVRWRMEPNTGIS
jgi:hypothetical protein